MIVEPDGLRVQQAMTETIRQVRPDAVSAAGCDRLARSIAPIRDVSDADDASALPDSARLLDVLGLEPPAAADIARRWKSGGRSTVAVVGESYDGPFGIDIRKDGPLGIHLILATQRPSGVVSADIRANTNLWIALRVTDPAESADVIGTPDAASIAKATPGRAYVRLGPASLVPFQAGRVGGRRPGADTPVTVKPWLAPLDWTDLGKPEPSRPAAYQRTDAEITDLTVLVKEIQPVARGLRIPRPRSPWLPPLPPVLLLANITPADRGREAVAGQSRRVPFGIIDLPAAQR